MLVLVGWLVGGGGGVLVVVVVLMKCIFELRKRA